MSHPQPARIHRRLFAFVYDALIVLALWLVSGLLAVGLSGGDVAPKVLTQAVVVMLIGGYFVISWHRTRATAGMRAWRLQVVNEDGSPLSWRQALIRAGYCTLFLAPLILPIFSAWLDPTKRTVYDRASRTRMIEIPKDARSASKAEE